MREKALAAFLKSAREEAKLSQSQMAEIIEKDRSMVSLIERGKTSITVNLADSWLLACGYQLMVTEESKAVLGLMTPSEVVVSPDQRAFDEIPLKYDRERVSNIVKSFMYIANREEVDALSKTLTGYFYRLRRKGRAIRVPKIRAEIPIDGVFRFSEIDYTEWDIVDIDGDYSELLKRAIYQARHNRKKAQRILNEGVLQQILNSIHRLIAVNENLVGVDEGFAKKYGYPVDPETDGYGPDDIPF